MSNELKAVRNPVTKKSITSYAYQPENTFYLFILGAGGLNSASLKC